MRYIHHSSRYFGCEITIKTFFCDCHLYLCLWQKLKNRKIIKPRLISILIMFLHHQQKQNKGRWSKGSSALSSPEDKFIHFARRLFDRSIHCLLGKTVHLHHFRLLNVPTFKVGWVLLFQANSHLYKLITVRWRPFLHNKSSVKQWMLSIYWDVRKVLFYTS